MQEKIGIARRTVTLVQVWNDYRRSRKLRPRTIMNYDLVLRTCFGDLLLKDIAELTKSEISSRHREITISRGASIANLAFKILKALLNFSAFQYEDENGLPIIQRNVVGILSATRQWNKEKPNRTYLRPNEIKIWYAEVQKIKDETLRDLLVFLLFSGLRRSEAEGLIWKDVDFGAETFTARDTKNGRDHSLPFNSVLKEILVRRKSAAADGSRFVFPAIKRHSEHHYLLHSRHKNLGLRMGLKWSPHSLRRTFGICGERGGVSFEIVKALLNHSPGDVTGKCYLLRDTETLRRPMQMVANSILVCI
jgi:integrase